ncbi:MAG: aminotransferase class III-fold pyridoxal phosphate-dependent enzyme [Pseudonocardia sp.]
MTNVFDEVESEVRSHCRNWPVVFDMARGSRLFDVDGRSYLDFFAGAGALNYGHNPPELEAALVDYLARDGVTHALDMHTGVKAEFLETFRELVLAPRGLDHKIQFAGPTGANAVESALKLARKVTGRESMVNFTDAFHGMTLGALSVTGNPMKRGGAGVPLVHATPMPCRRHDMLPIVDDVQMGCGRTGPFFSFELAGIRPDIVTLFKSISGYGLPMALVLIAPEYDAWAPGVRNGTFRGHNPAFVTATEALRRWWKDDTLERSTLAEGQRVGAALEEIAVDAGAVVKGRGLARGLQFGRAEIAPEVCAAAFARGVLMETAGPNDEVVKLLPPLTVTDEQIEEGLGILRESVRTVLTGAAA